jgi:hypothetical protein
MEWQIYSHADLHQLSILSGSGSQTHGAETCTASKRQFYVFRLRCLHHPLCLSLGLSLPFLHNCMNINRPGTKTTKRSAAAPVFNKGINIENEDNAEKDSATIRPCWWCMMLWVCLPLCLSKGTKEYDPS